MTLLIGKGLLGLGFLVGSYGLTEGSSGLTQAGLGLLTAGLLACGYAVVSGLKGEPDSDHRHDHDA